MLEAPTAGGQVPHHFRGTHVEIVEINHVEVRLHPRGDDASVVQVHRPRGVMRLVSHQRRQVDALAAVAVAAPVREQRGDEAGVADGADMRPAVAQPHHGVLMQDHLAAAVEVVVLVVGEWRIENVPAVVFDQAIVDVRPRLLACGRRTCSHAAFRRRLIVRRITQ